MNYLTYPVTNLGCSLKSLIAFIEGRLSGLMLFFSDYYNIQQFNIQMLSLHIFLGMSIFNRIEGNEVFLSLIYFCQQFSSLDFLHVLNLHLVVLAVQNLV